MYDLFKYFRLRWVLVLLMLGVSDLFAESTPPPRLASLEEAIQLALSKSPEVKEARSDVDIAKSKLEEVEGYRLPQLDSTLLIGPIPDARGDHLFSPDRADRIHGIGLFERAEMTLIQPIYTFGKITKGLEAAGSGVKIIGARFDFTEMAKRSLAAHWRERTPAEQKEFIHLFEKLLENSYLGKIEAYTDEKVVYTRELLEGDFSEVKTKILHKGDEIPIDYRLLRDGSDWRVYDIVIDGVSLVNNYRSQFNKIIRSASYEALVQKMRAKREEIALTP